MHSNAECPFCAVQAKALRVFAQRGNEELDLASCSECGLEFLNPQPSDPWLGEQYASYYKRRQSGTRPKVEFFSRILRNLPFTLDGRRVLEVGSAEGDCIFALSKIAPSADVTAVEAGDDCAHHYKDLNCKFLNMSIENWLASTASGENQKYDVIFAFDLIEHLRDPIGTLKNVSDRIADHGKIVATFPAVDSLSRRVLGRLWPQYKLEHLFYFSDSSVRLVSQKTGLKTVRLEFLSKTLSIDYLLAVASGFGPIPFRKISSLLRKVIPTPVKQLRVTAGFGEYLWIAEKS